ncbi:MAG TPA: tetratricopeptide repeat protein [Blastocatellia bacterium]|nr:tetratricopeptide repeat protein [Blastocatellia bacterium]
MKYIRPFISSSIAVMLLTSIILGASKSTFASTGQAKRPRKTAPAEPATQTLTPRDVLDRVRASTSQKERIDLLEKFLQSSKGSDVEAEAREMLMREYALRGEQNLREGSPQLAMQDFKNVFRLTPPTITDKIFGQYIFPLPMAMNAFGYRTESVQLMKSFESRFSADPNRLVQIGFFYVQIEAPLEAVRVLEQTVQLAPEDHRAHNSLGTAYLINLRLEDAAAEFERALQLNPRDEYANLNLAQVARARGDHQRAVTYYRKHIELKPDDSEARGGLAVSLLALGLEEEAEREIKRAMDVGRNDYRFLTQLAYFYATKKKTAVARPLIERAARIDPRYAWAHITKANIDLLESKYGDALTTLISAQTLGAFPTLQFELVKALMAVDGYDQAIEVMNKAFQLSPEGEFEALLGGAEKARSPRLDLLLERERQAALFLNEHPTTGMQYRLAEALGRIDYYLKVAKAARKPAGAASRRRARAQQASSAGASEGNAAGDELKKATRPRRAPASGTEGSLSGPLSAGADATLPGVAELLKAVTTFTTLDDGRQPFRMVWVARKLADNGIALDAAEQLARRAITVADRATEPEGYMRDAPLLDREGRRSVFLGRAHDVLGWTLLKKGDSKGAVENLQKSVQVYPASQERQTAVWHLAVATHEAGDEKRALDLYIASYVPDAPTSNERRSQIESLYKKLNGSLAGLAERLKAR